MSYSRFLYSIIGYLEIIDADNYKDEVRLRDYVNINVMDFLQESRLTCPAINPTKI